MQNDEFDHIRADIHTAILEAQQHDPTVTLEILWRLFDAVGSIDTTLELHQWKGNPQGTYYGAKVADWSVRLLREVQLRAISKTPYGEPRDDTPPGDPEERL